MGLLRQLLLSLNRQGRAFEGSSAYPAPPALHVPADLKAAIDDQEADDVDPDV